MKALLLAAGFGTRLRPITDTSPKCMVPIIGKPLLVYWLEMLRSAGVNDILVNTHYLAETVEDFVSKSEYQEFVTVVREENLLGTAGTLLKNRSFFNEEPVILIHADNLSIFNMLDFINAHQQRPRGSAITMMLFKTDMPQHSGIVELNKSGMVTAFHEKVEFPPGDLANAAVYIIEPEIFTFISKLNKSIIDFSTEVLPCFLNRINTFKNTIYHRDIGTVESYEKAQKEFVIIQGKGLLI